jgi:adenylate kinase family enzyme
MPHIDQDTYFFKDLPRAWCPPLERLVSLYDSVESVNWGVLSAHIYQMDIRKIIAITGLSGSGKSTVAKKLQDIQSDVLILSGFYLPPGKLREHNIHVDAYIILEIDVDTCIARRQASKGALSENFSKEKDAWMVHNYVIPFYNQGVQQVRDSDVECISVNALQPEEDVLAEVQKNVLCFL